METLPRSSGESLHSRIAKQGTTLLKVLRVAQNLEQAQLAAKTGVPQTCISLAERGLSIPHRQNRERLERYFGRPWSDLAAPAKVAEPA